MLICRTAGCSVTALCSRATITFDIGPFRPIAALQHHGSY